MDTQPEVIVKVASALAEWNIGWTAPFGEMAPRNQEMYLEEAEVAVTAYLSALGGEKQTMRVRTWLERQRPAADGSGDASVPVPVDDIRHCMWVAMSNGGSDLGIVERVRAWLDRQRTAEQEK